MVPQSAEKREIQGLFRHCARPILSQSLGHAVHQGYAAQSLSGGHTNRRLCLRARLTRAQEEHSRGRRVSYFWAALHNVSLATRCVRWHMASCKQRDSLCGDCECWRLVLGEDQFQGVHAMRPIPPDLLPLLHVKEGALPTAVVEHGQRRTEPLRVELALLEERVEADAITFPLRRLRQVERAHAVLHGHPLATPAIGCDLQRQHLAERLLHAGQVGRARLRGVLEEMRRVDGCALRALPDGAVDRIDLVVRGDGQPDELLVCHLDADA
eukprot:4081030-Prymnesium_polylepis.1